MKIKNDFVTNSSSTCYIVSLPENFEIKTKDDTVNEILVKFLKELKEFGSISFGMNADYNFEMPEDCDQIDIFVDEIRCNILQPKFLILEEEFGPDYPDRIININSKILRKKIKERYETKK